MTSSPWKNFRIMKIYVPTKFGEFRMTVYETVYDSVKKHRKNVKKRGLGGSKTPKKGYFGVYDQ